MKWDLFCRVIDNFGDLGVCWRLAADLGARGEAVRLWIDDASALAWMAPEGAAGVQVRPWSGAADAAVAAIPGDVVVEAFGCDPPAGFVARMAAHPTPPAWINLEYLSAQPYVERCHGLPSPQSAGPGAGLTKWFFYPGFTAATGGLLRESGLLERRGRFDAAAWLAARGLQRRPHERVVSLFCYGNAALPALLEMLEAQPTLLIAAAGQASAQLAHALGPTLARGALRAALLPHLSQHDYDHLLWSSELNFVRGEDSFVRAQWAGAPFVWQIYPQDDGAHVVKLDAFLAAHLAGAEATLAGDIARLCRRWNGLGEGRFGLPDALAWRTHNEGWRQRLAALPDLTTQLIGFAREKR